MRKVTKFEYNVLRKFYPGEVRYYIDLPAGKKVAKTKRKSNYTKKNSHAHNMPLQLTVHRKKKFKAGSMADTVSEKIYSICENDPTKVMSRSELLSLLVNRTIYSKQQVQTFLTDAIHKYGMLRMVGS